MIDAILVLNAGSSSIKFSLFSAIRESEGTSLGPVLRGQVEGLYSKSRFLAQDVAGEWIEDLPLGGDGGIGHDGAVEHLIWFFRGRASEFSLRAVGHRVVHGGMLHCTPVLIDPAILESLARFIPLAPLHQPHNLAPMRLVAERAPHLPQVACFDTAFHRTQPEVAQMFALPAEITDRGVRRYGFHGLSYEFVAEALRGLDPVSAAGRVVVAHLGNGSSMCAMRDGRSVATTMGFTALDGLPMGTRCGAIDPGVLLYCIDELKMDARALERLLYSQSGLLGVSGVSSDMRALLASEDPRAARAIDLLVHRIGRELGSLASALGGLDAMVFTAGIGEHAAEVRARVCRDAAWLGVDLDEAANAEPWRREGWRITTSSSRVAAWVVPTNEELMIARHTVELVPLAGRR